MIPSNRNMDIVKEKQTSRTYNIDFERNRVMGFVDEKAAIEQTVYKILNTQRYEHIIYSFNYGAEIEELKGKDKEFVKADLSRRIHEALIVDDRIKNTDNYVIRNGENRDGLLVRFDVITDFGVINVNEEVRI